jgi:hypothetical protein
MFDRDFSPHSMGNSHFSLGVYRVIDRARTNNVFFDETRQRCVYIQSYSDPIVLFFDRNNQIDVPSFESLR